MKASQTKAKSDMLAKGWTQTVKKETPSTIVCAPMLWGSYGGAGEWPAAFGTPPGCWSAEAAGTEAEVVWPEVQVEVGAWKDVETERSKAETEAQSDIEGAHSQAEADHEMRILNGRVT